MLVVKLWKQFSEPAMNNMQLPNPSGISNIYKLHADPTLHAPLSTPTKHPHTGCAGQVLQGAAQLAAGAPSLVCCVVCSPEGFDKLLFRTDFYFSVCVDAP